MRDPLCTALEDGLAARLPAGSAVAAGTTTGALAPLAPVEQAATARMSAGRLAEFTAGRAAARRALAALGVPGAEIPAGADRMPRWPSGYVGSITHAGGLVLAVAASSQVLRGIGIDLEPATPLDEDLVGRVCLPGELARFAADTSPAVAAKLLFSAKESVYKCVAPLAGVFLEFEHVEIFPDVAPGTFRARGHGPAAPVLAAGSVQGAWLEAAGCWISAAWEPAAPGPPA